MVFKQWGVRLGCILVRAMDLYSVVSDPVQSKTGGGGGLAYYQERKLRIRI